jgi:hypothetical protein
MPTCCHNDYILSMVSLLVELQSTVPGRLVS